MGGVDEGRCPWALGSATMTHYHDTEWGFAVVDDRHLFEKLCLEGFQSGLSWLTILRKRPAFVPKPGRGASPSACGRFPDRTAGRIWMFSIRTR